VTQLSLDGLRLVAAELADLEPLLTVVGEKAKEVILEEGRADTGGDLILSNFARGRVKMDVETTISGGTVSLKAVPPGPWMLIEAGSHKAGWWEPRKSRKTKLRFPDGNVRNYVRHGAVRAKNTFTRAAKRIQTDAPKWADEYVHSLVQKAA
jgi:hypothetical protein